MMEVESRLPEGLGRTLKPRHGVTSLKRALDDGLAPDLFVKYARVEAMLESCPKSLSSHAVGLRCWASFADAVLKCNGRHLPPSLEGLVAWSTIFCVAGVYSNYLTAVRFGCQLSGLPFQHTYHPDIKRAMKAVRAREPPRRDHKYIQGRLLKRMVAASKRDGCMREAAMYLCLYAFMMRAHAECLPLQRGSLEDLDCLPVGRHSAVALRRDQLCIRLARRKNKPAGSMIIRQCVCEHLAELCPVHALWPWLAQHDVGEAPFSVLSSKALQTLRDRLTMLSVKDPHAYGLHDFRRGHAQDMLERGAGLNAILQAGEWRSSAFAAYLKVADLEARAVLEADRARAADWVRHIAAEDSD